MGSAMAAIIAQSKSIESLTESSSSNRHAVGFEQAPIPAGPPCVDSGLARSGSVTVRRPPRPSPVTKQAGGAHSARRALLPPVRCYPGPSPRFRQHGVGRLEGKARNALRPPDRCNCVGIGGGIFGHHHDRSRAAPLFVDVHPLPLGAPLYGRRFFVQGLAARVYCARRQRPCTPPTEGCWQERGREL